MASNAMTWSITIQIQCRVTTQMVISRICRGLKLEIVHHRICEIVNHNYNLFNSPCGLKITAADLRAAFLLGERGKERGENTSYLCLFESHQHLVSLVL